MQAPDRDVVEIEAVGVLGFQGLDPEVLLGDLGQESVDRVHGCFREEVIEVERMNALLLMEAKRILKKD